MNAPKSVLEFACLDRQKLLRLDLEFVNKPPLPLKKSAPGETLTNGLILKGFMGVNKSLISFYTFCYAGGALLLKTFPVEPINYYLAEEVSAGLASVKLNSF